MQRQDDPLQCEEVLDVSDISQLPTLWLQRLVISGDIKMTRVETTVLTWEQHLAYQTMNRHLKFCGLRFAKARARLHPS